MRKICPHCGHGVNENSCVSRVTDGNEVYHFACFKMKEAGFKPSADIEIQIGDPKRKQKK